MTNRHLVAQGGKTAYKRTHHRDLPATQLEFVEQVMARFTPKRAKSKKKTPFAPRSIPGTWVGAHEATTGNIVILLFVRAVGVRTAFRRPGDERWCLERVMTIKAAPGSPNPSSPEENIIVLRFDTEGESKSGKDPPSTPVQPSTSKKRDVKFTRGIVEENGFTDGCVGCEALQTGGGRRTHSTYSR